MCCFYSLNHGNLFVGHLKGENTDGGVDDFSTISTKKICSILVSDSRETHTHTEMLVLFYIMSIIIVIAHSFPT